MIWSARRRWLGNLIPLAMGLVVGCAAFLQFDLWGAFLGVGACWFGINWFGFFENSNVEVELREKLDEKEGELIGFVFDRPADALDAHAEIGILSFRDREIRILTEDRAIVANIKSVKRERNIHSFIFLGGWIRLDSDVGPIKLESRKHRTMFASARATKELYRNLGDYK